MPAEEPRQERSDVSLLAECAAGGSEALGILYDRYARQVYAFLSAAAAARNGSDLDDLVHDTFLAAFGAARRFSGRSSVKTWLFGIAVNVSRNYIRREMRRRKALDHYQAVDASTTRPDEQAQSAQQLSQVTKAIAELPEKLRLAYVTCVLGGIPGKDAARMLRVRKGTLWRRVHEAREQLREATERGER